MNQMLAVTGLGLETMDKTLKSMINLAKDQGIKDERMFRCHLILSELAELFDAMSRHSEVDALDALADITYVVFGTAAVYDLPLAEAFEEVHRSNMTKDSKLEHAAGINGKGKRFQPADLVGVLKAYRDRTPHLGNPTVSV